MTTRSSLLLTVVPLLLVWNLEAGDYRDASRELGVAVRQGDVHGFLGALGELLRENESRAVRLAVEAYARMAERVARDDTGGELYYLHRKSAALFSRVTEKPALLELASLRKKAKNSWSRLLLLDAAAFCRGLSLEKSCVDALEDTSPLLVRRALRYLGRNKKVSVLEKVVERYVELSEKKPKGKASEWERVFLAFDAALQQMLHVDLFTAVDWKNYVMAHKDETDLFDPARRRTDSVTQLTLFGAAVTGKNIIFVLDVSGSMLTTDPLPPGEQQDQGRTVVVDPRKPRGPRVPPADRRRINRAKKELTKVVQALPPDVRFNIIAYSTEVWPWKRSMTGASESAKKNAAGFISEMRAEGITVTDRALEDAFSDLAVDTVYLITDGAPTHIGSTGPGKPEDADELIAQILLRTRELNFLRDVRIFTLGFRSAEEEFLKKLSREHSGRYVRIK